MYNSLIANKNNSIFPFDFVQTQKEPADIFQNIKPLPSEILLQIFSSKDLSIKDLSRVSRVSKAFNRLASDGRIWSAIAKTLKFKWNRELVTKEDIRKSFENEFDSLEQLRKNSQALSYFDSLLIKFRTNAPSREFLCEIKAKCWHGKFNAYYLAANLSKEQIKDFQKNLPQESMLVFSPKTNNTDKQEVYFNADYIISIKLF